MNRKVELDLLQLLDGCFDVAKSKFRGSLCLLNSVKIMSNARGGGGTLGIPGWGCAAWTLKPLTYSRANSAEFCYPILE